MESENNDLKRIFSGKDLAKLIFPLVIELMLTLLVGMIDSVMVSSAGEAAVSGVSLVDTVFQLLIYIFSAFGTGGAVVAGQYLGAGQKNNAKETAQQLVWFSAFSSCRIIYALWNFCDYCKCSMPDNIRNTGDSRVCYFSCGNNSHCTLRWRRGRKTGSIL